MCNLKTVLAKRKLTIASFARISGMSGSTIGALCSGRHNMPHQDTASKVASALGMTVAEIWPELELHKAAHAAKQREALLAYNQLIPRQSKPKPPAKPRPVRVPDIRLHPSSPNAVPTAQAARSSGCAWPPCPMSCYSQTHGVRRRPAGCTSISSATAPMVSTGICGR